MLIVLIFPVKDAFRLCSEWTQFVFQVDFVSVKNGFRSCSNETLKLKRM